MSGRDNDQEKARQEEELRTQRQIAFASGLFLGDVTVRTLLESLVEGVVIIDSSGTILLVNTAAERMFGYQKKELIGKPQAMLIPERFRKVHEEHQAHFFAEPRISTTDQHLALTGLHRSGSEFPVEISLNYIETINGVLALAFVSDITLCKQYMSSLRESEELFRIQVECVKDYAIFMLDTRGYVLNWNAGAERLKGYQDKEIIGKHFTCFYPEEERNAGKPEEELNKAATEGRVAYEGWRIRKDGSRFWADVIITSLYDDSGNLRGFSKVTHDITGRKRAEDALRFSEARYRALFHDNPTMIVTLDADLIMLSVNPSCAVQLGYTIDELKGRSVLTLFHEDDRPAVAGQLQRCLQNPDQVNCWQHRKVRKDGELLWVEETAQAVYDLNGSLNLLVVCQDVTERKRMDDEIKRISMQNELILASAGEGIIGLDLEGNQTFVNAAAAAMLGYDINELVGKQSHSIWHYARPDGSDYPMEKCPVYAAYKDGTVYSGEEMFLRKDGTGFPVQFTSRPIFLDEKIAGAVLTFNDISERKQMEDALRKSEKKFLTVFHAVPAILGITTLAEGRFVDVNETCIRILGYQRDEVIGHTSLELGIWESQADRNKAMRTLEEHGKVRDVEIKLRGKSGDILVGLLSAEFIEIDGELYILSMINDITERKRMEEEIERLNTDLASRAVELEDANRELESFNYTVAHDLRNPLNVVSSYCQVLKELCSDKFDEQCRHYLQEAYDGTVRMNGLIEALLEFSRLAHAELNREVIDFSTLVHEVAAELKLAAPERRVTFRIAGGIHADGDAALLRLVLENLLGNAWKYTVAREEGIIEFGITEAGGKPAYFIRDNGAGFDMADADKLFAPFQRLPGAEECRGFGIGLTSVQRIIRRHGGKVWAKGEPGRGAVFYFTLAANGVST